MIFKVFAWLPRRHRNFFLYLLMSFDFLLGFTIEAASANGLNLPGRLSQLYSFEFSLDYQTDTPILLRGHFSGIWQNHDKEFWNGIWERNREKVTVKLYGDGEEQLEKTGPEWRKSPRGIETRVLKQIEQVVYNTTFEFIGEKPGRLLYQFIPSLPLIDPLRFKKLSGIVEIDKKSGLPVRIYCWAEGSIGKWEMKFYSFNRAKKITVPFIPVLKLRIVNPEQRMSCVAWKRTTAILKTRLKQFGIDFRVKRIRGGLELDLSQKLAPRNLELLFSNGKVEIWTSKKVDENNLSEEKVFFIQGDAAQPIVLSQLVGVNRQLRVEPIFELPVEPKLKVCFPFLQENDYQLIALVINDIVLDAVNPVKKDECIFTNIGSEEVARIISALASQEPLSVTLKVNIISP